MTRVPALPFSSAGPSFESVEAVRVEDDGNFVFLDYAAHELRGFRMARNARPDRQHRLCFDQRVEAAFLQ